MRGGDPVMAQKQQWLATRLVRLCLRDGKLPAASLLGSTTRAALLADLAFSGALTVTETSVELDTTPTGFPAADNLLGAVARDPSKKMEWWLRRGPNSVRDIVSDLLTSSVWSRPHPLFPHRYRDNAPSAVDSDTHRVRIALNGKPDSAHTAALAVIAQAAGCLPWPTVRQPDADLVLACSPIEWLLRDCVAFLVRRRDMLDVAEAEGRAWLGANFIR